MEGTRTRIRELREARELSQGQLAQKLQVDRSYINKLENGHRLPGRDLTFRLARVFGILAEKLFLD